MGAAVSGQRLLPGADGLYIGADPGTKGALAAVLREGDRLTLRGVWYAEDGAAEDPAQRAAETVGRAFSDRFGCPRMPIVRGVSVEGTFASSAIPGGQAGALKLSASGGAYAGALLALTHPAVYERPLPADWLADLACLADGPDTDKKALHVARLLDVCPGALPFLMRPRARLAHDGGADAALIALWAAGLRGPGPSSPLWRLAVCEGPPDWLARVRVDTGDAVAWPTGTAQQLSAVGGGGRWAAARGRVQAEPSAVDLLRGIARAGSPARAKAASAALLAWGVTDGD